MWGTGIFCKSWLWLNVFNVQTTDGRTPAQWQYNVHVALMTESSRAICIHLRMSHYHLGKNLYGSGTMMQSYYTWIKKNSPQWKWLTRAAQPELDPPVVRDGSRGFITGPYVVMKLYAEACISSQVALPLTQAPEICSQLSALLQSLISSHTILPTSSKHLSGQFYTELLQEHSLQSHFTKTKYFKYMTVYINWTIALSAVKG